MNVASLEAVSKRHAEKVVLDGVTFGIADGERVGVIGSNGSGKSTLLRLVAGVEEPDSGRVVVGNAVRVRYLAQEPALESDVSALGAVLAADTPAARTARAFERAAAAVRTNPLDGDAVLYLESVTASMDAAGGWDVEHRARALLGKLGIGEVDAPVGRRSGGERKRVALAAALLEPAELLILDEPTNHLDVDVVEWLQERLVGWPRALLLVTHDRYLLDSVATRIVEVHAGSLHAHAGSYANYLEARADREAQAAAVERRRENRARTELEWLRRGPRARTSKARYRVDQAEALLESTPDPERGGVEIALPSRRLGGKVVNLHNAGVSFGERRVLHGVDYKVSPDDRIGVVGPNGSGKTTLLRLIAGEVEPDEGSVRRGETVHPAFFRQDPSRLPPRVRVLDAVLEVVRETQLTSGVRVTAGGLLERFGFPAETQKAWVEELSGGERRRLELLLVLADAPNLLLLDEPTNDLDLETLGVLEDYLDTFPGAVVVATHDRFFLDRVCDSVFGIEPGGVLRHHPGGWSAYREHRREHARVRSAPRVSNGRGSPSPSGSHKRTFNEERELRQLERRLEDLGVRVRQLTDELGSIASDHERLVAVGSALAAVSAELDATESRWLELSMVGDET